MIYFLLKATTLMYVFLSDHTQNTYFILRDIHLSVITVYSWYLQIYGTKQTTIEEKLKMVTIHRIHCCIAAILFIFPIMSPNFCSWHGAFQQTSNFHFFGYCLLVDREALSRSHNNLSTTDNSTGLTESFSILTKLCNAALEFKIFISEISFDF
jgi:hypothetical protein